MRTPPRRQQPATTGRTQQRLPTAKDHPHEPVVVHIGGIKRTLRYTLGALKRILADRGKDFLSQESTGGDPAAELDRISYLLWQGLLHEDPGLTQEELDELVELHEMAELGEAVARALFRDVPQPAAGEGPHPPGAQRQRGRTG